MWEKVIQRNFPLKTFKICIVTVGKHPLGNFTHDVSKQANETKYLNESQTMVSSTGFIQDI